MSIIKKGARRRPDSLFVSLLPDVYKRQGLFPLGTLPGPPGTAGGLFRLLRRLGRRGRLNRGSFFLAPAQILFMLGLLRPALGRCV